MRGDTFHITLRLRAALISSIGVLAVCVIGLRGVSLASAAGANQVATRFLPSGAEFGSLVVARDGSSWIGEDTHRFLLDVTSAGAVKQIPLKSAPADFGMVLGPDGNIWVTGAHPTPMLARVSLSGDVSYLNLPGLAAGTGVATGPDGALWVAGQAASQLQLWRIGAAGGITEYPAPGGLEFGNLVTGADGTLWIDDWRNIVRFTVADSRFTYFPLGTKQYWLNSVGQGPHRSVWFASGPATPAIGEVHLSGRSDIRPSGASSIRPSGIADGPDGRVYFTSYFGGVLGRVEKDGRLSGIRTAPFWWDGAGISSGPDRSLRWVVGQRDGRETILQEASAHGLARLFHPTGPTLPGRGRAFRCGTISGTGPQLQENRFTSVWTRRVTCETGGRVLRRWGQRDYRSLAPVGWRCQTSRVWHPAQLGTETCTRGPSSISFRFGV